jgi:hypothetical protein
MNLSLRLLALVSLCSLLLCAVPPSPMDDPNNARIDADNSLTSFPAETEIGKAVQCTVAIKYPRFVDSMYVYQSLNGTETLIDKEQAGTDLVIFTFVPGQGGTCELIIYVTKTNDTRDTLRKSIYVFSPVPSVVADSASYHGLIRDSVTLQFTLRDHNADLKCLLLWQDSVTQNSIIRTVNHDSIAQVAWKVAYPSQSKVVWFAQAVDSIIHTSEIVSCTVSVSDTVNPLIGIPHVKTALNDTLVHALPCTVTVLVHDDSPLDSVKFVNTPKSIDCRMARIGTSDTFTTIVSSLDSGKAKYSISAWDIAGNESNRSMALSYYGAVPYPPILGAKLAGQTIKENQQFKPIYLDSCVSVDSLRASYPKTQITWNITEQDPAKGPRVVYDTTQRICTLTIAPADSEWSGSEAVGFRAIAPGTNGFAERILTFAVDSINDTPRITLGTQRVFAPAVFDTLKIDTCAHDPDNTPASMKWTIKRGKYFVPDSIWLKRTCLPGDLRCISLSYFSGRIAIAPDTSLHLPSTWTGTDTLQFTVEDPAGARNTKKITFTKSDKLIIIQPPLLHKRNAE